MKNIIIIDEYSSLFNGIGTYINELINVLKNSNVNIYIIIYNSNNKDFLYIIEDDIKKMYLPPIPHHYCDKIIDKFAALYINDSKENIFLFNHTPFESLIRVIKKRFPLSKFWLTIHNMVWTMQYLGDVNKLEKLSSKIEQGITDEKNKVLEELFKEEQRMYNLSDIIIALTHETKKILQLYYKIDANKIKLIPNGLRDLYTPISIIKKREIKLRLHLNINEKIIIFVGRISIDKGIYPLIESFKKILDKFPYCRLIIIGTIPNLINIIEYSKDIAAKITFTGQIGKSELKKWYSIADIGVLPSYFEQCSYTGIEMMMNKLAIIASNGLCVNEMFKENLNAKIAKIENVEYSDVFTNNLTQCLFDLLSSKKMCNELKNQARIVYESKYSINYMKNKYLALIDT